MAHEFQTISATSKALHAKEFSARELTQSYLDRIDSRDKEIQSYLDVFHTQALAAADAADKKLADGTAGTLTGMPLGIKDIIMIEGETCTAGSKILEGYQATYDAHVISQLKHSGSVFLGKTSLDEFAMGSSNENTELKQARNPWDTTRVPGGSSGGSAAAVAADLCIAALGTDTGGSVRQPAAFCGVVGMKPTYGRVSRHGVMAMTSSLDQVGPLTRSVEDATLLFNTIAGHDTHDATTRVTNPSVDIQKLAQPIKGMKIGLPKEFFVEGMDPQIRKLVEDAADQLRALGAEVIEVSLSLTQYALAVYQLTATSEISSNMARYDGMRYGHSVEAERLIDVYRQSRAEGFGSEVKRRIMLGTFALSAGYHDQYYVQAQKVRTLIQKEYTDIFKKVDCLIGPTTPSVAFVHGEKFNDPLLMYLSDIYTVPANIGGICAISVPGGYAGGLPVGVQFMAGAFAEQTLFQVAHQYEQATTWHTMHPDL